MKQPISAAEFRRRFPPGTKFTAEFMGVNRQIANPENIRTQREVVSQGPKEMVSKIVDRVPDKFVVLNWKGTKVEQEEKRYSIMQNGEEFLAITVD